MDYYEGYLLDDMQIFSLTADDKNLLDACIWIVDHRSTIQSASDNFDFSKSTLHRLIHSRVRSLSDELYLCVCAVLDSHKK